LFFRIYSVEYFFNYSVAQAQSIRTGQDDFPNGSAIPALIYQNSLSSPQLLQTRPYALMNGV
jgi:hypothetical protein